MLQRHIFLTGQIRYKTIKGTIQVCNICILQEPLWINTTTRERNNGINREWQDSQMVQQLCQSTKTKWHSTPVPLPQTTQSGTNRTNTQMPNSKWYINKAKECALCDPIRWSPVYNRLKCDKKSQYLTILSCLSGRHRFTRLPLRVVPARNMLWQKNSWNFQTPICHKYTISVWHEFKIWWQW